MKKYSVTVNGVVYDVTVEEISGAVSAPAAPAPTASSTPAPVLPLPRRLPQQHQHPLPQRRRRHLLLRHPQGKPESPFLRPCPEIF